MKTIEAIGKYLAYKRGYLNPRSLERYKMALYKFAENFCGDIEKINWEIISNFQNDLYKKYHRSSPRFFIIVLRDFIKFHVGERENILINPVNIKFARSYATPHEVLSDIDFEFMDISVRGNDLRNLAKRLMHNLLWDTGMRVSELCELDIRQICEDKCFHVLTKKSKQWRWVWYGEKTSEILKKYLQARKNFLSEALFISVEKCGTGERVNNRTIERWVKSMCKKAGVKNNVVPHSYRHAKAHRILKAGGTVKDVQLVLGHSGEFPITSFKYLNFNKDECRERQKIFL
jgi:site-specific recombinase XerD